MEAANEQISRGEGGAPPLSSVTILFKIIKNIPLKQ
jgi:hypothetical protein